jgi:hypothetical protein
MKIVNCNLGKLSFLMLVVSLKSQMVFAYNCLIPAANNSYQNAGVTNGDDCIRACIAAAKIAGGTFSNGRSCMNNNGDNINLDTAKVYMQKEWCFNAKKNLADAFSEIGGFAIVVAGLSKNIQDEANRLKKSNTNDFVLPSEYQNWPNNPIGNSVDNIGDNMTKIKRDIEKIKNTIANYKNACKL